MTISNNLTLEVHLIGLNELVLITNYSFNIKTYQMVQ